MELEAGPLVREAGEHAFGEAREAVSRVIESLLPLVPHPNALEASACTDDRRRGPALDRGIDTGTTPTELVPRLDGALGGTVGGWAAPARAFTGHALISALRGEPVQRYSNGGTSKPAASLFTQFKSLRLEHTEHIT